MFDQFSFILLYIVNLKDSKTHLHKSVLGNIKLCKSLFAFSSDIIIGRLELSIQKYKQNCITIICTQKTVQCHILNNECAALCNVVPSLYPPATLQQQACSQQCWSQGWQSWAGPGSVAGCLQHSATCHSAILHWGTFHVHTFTSLGSFYPI